MNASFRHERRRQMNGQACCILGICCPPGSAAQEDALAKEMIKDGVCDPEYAFKVSKWILKHFDLAPVGSLTDLKTAIATMARKSKV
jgi:hypothetical protein